MIVSRECFTIASDGGRIGSLAAEARRRERRRQRMTAAGAQLEREVFEAIDVAVVGEDCLERRGRRTTERRPAS